MQNQSGIELAFRFKKTSPLQNLFDYYCKKMHYSSNLVKFMFNGVCLKATLTPKELDMKDGSVIEVVQVFENVKNSKDEEPFTLTVILLLQITG